MDIKRRELRFVGPHPCGNQAEQAAALFTDLPGISVIAQPGNDVLILEYHLQQYTYTSIESILMELGFHLDNSVLQKIRRAFYSYTEDIQRDTAGFHEHPSRDVFIQRYRAQTHGCQDHRPKHWRSYW